MTTAIDLKKLNSITKYPSILTYHELAKPEKNGLVEARIDTSIFESEEDLHVYEKIDGENSRIIFIGDGEEVDYFIGSRKELLHAKGDRIAIPTGNIADYFRPIADRLEKELQGLNGVLVIYFESYGGLTPKAKLYTKDKTQYGRVFDAFRLTPETFNSLLEKEANEIASWRDNGGQPYMPCEEREALTKQLDLPAAPLLANLKGSEIPTTIEATYAWLKTFRETKSGINECGKAEGVIVRRADRKKITKIRFEDYEKTFRYLERQKEK